MKKYTCKCLSAVLIAAALTMTAAPASVQAAAPKLNKTSASLTTGSKLKLKIRNAKEGAAIKWSSSKKSVASVSKKGVVTAKSEGTATIQAVISKKTLTCKVTVTESTENEAQDISALLAGRSYKGTASVNGLDIEALTLSFGSDNAVSGSKLSETTFLPEEFSGTYQAVRSGKTVTITVEADGKKFSYPLKVESEDYSELSASVGGFEVSVVEVKN